MADIDDIIARLDSIQSELDEIRAEVNAPHASLESPAAIPKPMAGLTLPDEFYNFIRGDVGELFPTMSDAQFAGIEMDLHLGAGVLPLSWMAYVLATDYHETGKRMVGVREGFDVSDEWRKQHLRYYPWYGRGKVQLTWEKNYVFATQRLKALGLAVDLHADPDLALQLDVAGKVLVVGMLEGWFTGKKLRDFLPAQASKQHYINARQIVNGTDKAELIAGYAMVFESALKRGEWL